MIQFIIKYWIQVFFGIVVTGLGMCIKHYYKIVQAYKKNEQNILINQIKEEVETSILPIKKLIDEVNNNNNILAQDFKNIKLGVLTLMKNTFKKHCSKILESDCKISLQEFNELQEEHEAYNKLGGNHTGDQLFEMICNKYLNK